MAQGTKDRLFTTSIDVVRRSRMLELHRSSNRWGWLFRTYIQWHAVAYLLAELCVRTKGPEVDEAWAVIDNVFDEWGGNVASEKKGMLWKPMRKLMSKARAARKRERDKELLFPTDGSLGPMDLSKGLRNNPMLSMPGANDLTGFAPMQMPANNYGLGVSTGMNGYSSIPTTLSTSLSPTMPLSNPAIKNEQGMAQWLADDSPIMQDPSSGDEATMNWNGWDDMVRDFQMEGVQTPGFESGPVLSGMGDWW